MIKIALIEFPGNNCERETALAVKRAGMEPVSALWHQTELNFNDFDGFILIGGFSYEDRVRSGRIAAMHPIMDKLKAQDQLGKPILGICNGAQALVESGLVPGLDHYELGMALTENRRIQNGKLIGTGYYNAWVNIKPNQIATQKAFANVHLPFGSCHVPIAHGEGQFVIPTQILNALHQAGATIWYYCDETGRIGPEFPTNPNGSIENIAGISNARGNVLALMPHPERTRNGDPLFASLRDFILKQQTTPKTPNDIHLKVTLTKPVPSPLKIHANQTEIIVQSMITDNTAVTLETALQTAGFAIELQRYQHWFIHFKSEETRTTMHSSQQIMINSFELLNPNKERVISSEELAMHQDRNGGLLASAEDLTEFALLIHAKQDVLGQQKTELFFRHYQIPGLNHIQHGQLWKIRCLKKELSSIQQLFYESPLLFNPFAHIHSLYTLRE